MSGLANQLTASSGPWPDYFSNTLKEVTADGIFMTDLNVIEKRYMSIYIGI